MTGADAMVANLPDILLLLLTADCLPVLFVDQRNGLSGQHMLAGAGALAACEATVAAICATGASAKTSPPFGAICHSYQMGADMAIYCQPSSKSVPDDR